MIIERLPHNMFGISYVYGTKAHNLTVTREELSRLQYLIRVELQRAPDKKIEPAEETPTDGS